jgi:hypothetical protein
MNRYRWLSAEFKVGGFEHLRKQIISCQYNEEAGDGFRLNFSRDDMVSGKYIVRMNIEETTVDPFGSVISNSRVIYEIYEFTISSLFPEITLINPPRSCRSLFTKLSVLSDFTLFISTIDINVEKWIQNIESTKNIKSQIHKVSCSGISLSPSVKGQITIIGTEDVRKYISRLAGDGNFNIDKAKVLLSGPDVNISCELSKTATALIYSGDLRYSKKLLMESIPRC